VVYPGSKYYPERLLPLAEQYPISPVLFCIGLLSLLKSEGVAIVGSRHPSEESLRIAKKLASDLALSGKNIVSGYAKGIDTSAHLGALEAGGTTTIVIGSGIKGFSIRREFNDFNLARDALVVSQFAPNERWSGVNAMARNKTVCILAEAVVVVESGKERDNQGKMSGTFDAARSALKLQIPLFVFSPASFKRQPSGNSELIKLGGIEITPDNGLSEVLSRIGKPENSLELVSSCKPEQLSFAL